MTHWRQRTEGAERDVMFFTVGMLVGAMFMVAFVLSVNP